MKKHISLFIPLLLVCLLCVSAAALDVFVGDGGEGSRYKIIQFKSNLQADFTHKRANRYISAFRGAKKYRSVCTERYFCFANVLLT